MSVFYRFKNFHGVLANIIFSFKSVEIQNLNMHKGKINLIRAAENIIL